MRLQVPLLALLVLGATSVWVQAAGASAVSQDEQEGTSLRAWRAVWEVVEPPSRGAALVGFAGVAFLLISVGTWWRWRKVGAAVDEASPYAAVAGALFLVYARLVGLA